VFPKKAKQKVGFALYFAQQGQKHEAAKPLKGFAGAGVLEIIADHDKSAYRAVYTVRFAEAVYVLHVFQKKATLGIATRWRDVKLVKDRLREAMRIHAGLKGAGR
jgi:phage-related protein